MHELFALWNWYKRELNEGKTEMSFANLLFLYEKGNSDKANSGIWDSGSRPIIDMSHYTHM